MTATKVSENLIQVGAATIVGDVWLVDTRVGHDHAQIVLADDRAIRATYANGFEVYKRDEW